MDERPVNEMERPYLPRLLQGITVFFTGLSGAGKSTTANVLLTKFLERDKRPVTLLDGDAVRKHLSPDLGFSIEDRDLHIRRIGSLASEITQNGGIVICAVIAPFDRTRKEARALIEKTGGGFLLVHIATPLPICEKRDPKGLYARARAGALCQFTGISDPYEVPSDADLVIDTSDITPEHAARLITDRLEREGYLPSHTSRLCPEFEELTK